MIPRPVPRCHPRMPARGRRPARLRGERLSAPSPGNARRRGNRLRELPQRLRRRGGARPRLDAVDPDVTGQFDDKDAAPKTLDADCERLRRCRCCCSPRTAARCWSCCKRGRGRQRRRGASPRSALDPQASRVHAFYVPTPRRSRARFPVARARGRPGARRDRGLQPLALRGRARARVHELSPRSRSALARIVDFETPRPGRHGGDEVLSAHHARRAAAPVQAAPGRSAQAVEDRPQATTRSASAGTNTATRTKTRSRRRTARAPWFIVPANHKWFRNLAVTAIVDRDARRARPAAAAASRTSREYRAAATTRGLKGARGYGSRIERRIARSRSAGGSSATMLARARARRRAGSSRAACGSISACTIARLTSSTGIPSRSSRSFARTPLRPAAP